ncbi:MAG: hypothetical protein ACKOPO_03050 [Novosphingobium sp.]
MDASLLEDLPALHRLAMAYAPGSLKPQWLGFFALDARLAGVVHQAREPVLAQLRLAWWRDRLGEGAARTAKGEPLLAALAEWPDGGTLLEPLVNAWEQVLDPDNASLPQAFAAARAEAASAFARMIGADPAQAQGLATAWSRAEIALWGLDDAARKARDEAVTSPVGRPLRPLLVMQRVTAMAARKGSAAALASPAALFTAMRAGLLGR